MLDVRVTSNFRQFIRQAQARRSWMLRYATATSLTWTAKDVQTNVVKNMERRFDRPTRWTLKGIWVSGAKARQLTASVYFKEFGGAMPAGKYLRTQITGGPRRAKRSERSLRIAGIMRPNEFWVPGRGARLDAHGNISGGEMRRILSQLQASPNRDANETAKTRRRKLKRGASRYFVADGEGRLPRGVWKRTGHRIEPILIFVDGAPSYRRRLPFQDIARKTVAARLPIQFRRAWAHMERRFRR